MEEITAKLVLTQEEIAYIWHGGTLAVKIDAPDMKVFALSGCRQNVSLPERARALLSPSFLN